jgi:hypothetical protein
VSVLIELLIVTGIHGAVVFVEFNRSPEAQFPIPVEEAHQYSSRRKDWHSAAEPSLDVVVPK